MNGTVFSRSEVVVVRATVLWEVDRETSCVDECDAARLLASLGASIHILLIGVGLTLQLFKLCEFKALLHAPLNNAAIARDRDEELSLAFSLDPLDFPDDVTVLAIEVLALGHWFVIVRPHIVNGNVSVRVANSNQGWILLGELTTRDTVLRLNHLLRVSRILQSPETEVAILEVTILHAADIELTVTSGNQILVSLVDIDASDGTVLSEVTLENEELFERDIPIFQGFVLFFLLFFLFFLVGLLFEEPTDLAVTFLLVFVGAAERTLVDLGIVFVLHMLLMELRLSQQTLNDSDSKHHGVWQLLIDILNLLDFAEVSGSCLGAQLVGASLTHGCAAIVVAGLGLVNRFLKVAGRASFHFGGFTATF
jgi:hypothetical protein